MGPQSHPEALLADLAASQHGAFSHEQARACGFSDRAIRYRLETGRWIRILPRTYRVSGATPSFRQGLWGAWLWAGSAAVISHRAAAALLGLDLDEGVVEVTSPRRRRVPRGVVVHHGVLPSRDVVSRGGLPVTNATRTVIDLGAVCDEETVETALDSALRQGLTSIPYLCKRLSVVGGRGRRGVAVIRRLLSLRDPGTSPAHSPLATKVARLLRKGGLPHAVNEYVIQVGDRSRRVDLAYPDSKVAIECHSMRWHFGLAAWERDILRDEELRALGWELIYVTHRQLLHDPDAVLVRIRTALGLVTFDARA